MILKIKYQYKGKDNIEIQVNDTDPLFKILSELSPKDNKDVVKFGVGYTNLDAKIKEFVDKAVRKESFYEPGVHPEPIWVEKDDQIIYAIFSYYSEIETRKLVADSLAKRPIDEETANDK